MQIEIWKSLGGYEGIYEVSNLGRIKSFYNTTVTDSGILPYRILEPFIGQHGYYKTRLSKGGKNIEVLIHRLIAQTFKPNTTPKLVVNHLDGNKLNNNIDNLEWCTQGENIRHAFKIGLKEGNKGEKNPNAILTPDQVIEIDKLLKQGVLNNIEIADEFDIDPVTITNIKTGKTWGWLTKREQKPERKELGPKVVEEIYKLAKEGKIYQKTIAKMFGISQAHVSEILNGKMWPNITSKL